MEDGTVSILGLVFGVAATTSDSKTPAPAEPNSPNPAIAELSAHISPRLAQERAHANGSADEPRRPVADMPLAHRLRLMERGKAASPLKE